MQKHTCLLVTVLPVFLFTALFRVGSLAVILAWDWTTSLTALTFWGASFLVGLLTIRCCGHCFCCAPWQMACFHAGFRSTNEEPEENEEPISFIARGCIENNVNVNEVPRPSWLPTRRFMEDLTLGEVLTGFVSEMSTISNWGGRGREKSRGLQLGTSIYFLFFYTCITPYFWTMTSPASTSSSPAYYKSDPKILQVCSIASLSFGVVAFVLQIFLPRILRLHS